MELKQYIEELQQLYENFGNLKLFYSTDDEGNNIKHVNFSPAVFWHDKEDNTFYSSEEIEEAVDEDMRKILQQCEKVVIIN